MGKKQSRNDACACGSGKKFKKCCINLNSSAQNLNRIARAIERGKVMASEQAEKVANRVAKFGYVRPVISADHKGKKFVAVGNELHHSSQWRTFPDFLDNYLISVLTPAWCNAELKKPLERRHVILQWHYAARLFQNKQTKGPDGLYAVKPTGPMRAFLLLAYDLYVLRDHGKLQTNVVNRLRHPDQFQGARHELLAAATCIRAGCKIDYEDERDNSRKHPELIATHSITGQMLALEAKSRHRPGVLGHPGNPTDSTELRAGIERLLKNAIDKSSSEPFVIFIDINLPCTKANIAEEPWVREVLTSLSRFAETRGGCDPFNLIVFSNNPDHYLDPEVPAAGGGCLSLLGVNPPRQCNEQALMAIVEAAGKFGMIPTMFED